MPVCMPHSAAGSLGSARSDRPTRPPICRRIANASFAVRVPIGILRIARTSLRAFPIQLTQLIEIVGAQYFGGWEASHRKRAAPSEVRLHAQISPG